MAVKTLLLDIDGVLVRDRLLMAHVQDNCVQYVRSKLPEAKDPAAVNRILYQASGHTARGLAQSFKIDTRDFNAKVYDRKLIDHLSEVLYGTEFQQEAKEIHELTNRGWNVTLFTNSPIEWARPVAMAIGDVIGVDCTGSDPAESSFKPDAARYTNHEKHQTRLYVDDSLKNLGTARFLPNWHPIHFSEGPVDAQSWCPQVHSIWEMLLYVNSVDMWIRDS